MKPPPVRASLVVYGPTPQPLSEKRCDQMWPLTPHSAPSVGCTNDTKSTKPSSSPELGMPSGPSLSYWPKLTAPSLAASVCWMSVFTPDVPHRPLHVPAPAYVASGLGSVVQPYTVPFTVRSPYEISV